MSLQVQRTSVRRRHEVRESNDRIADTAERYHFLARAPMLCECGAARCAGVFPIDVDEYWQARHDYPDCILTLPGHHIDGADPALKLDDYWLQL
jgi:hypothetical protein